MKLAILGATGGAGQELTKQALALGHTVKVLVRSPDKVTVTHDRLEVVKTDVLNESAATLAEKLGGSEVVLSALGVLDLGITRFYSESARQLLAAAQQAHVKRLLIVSSVVQTQPLMSLVGICGSCGACSSTTTLTWRVWNSS